MVGIKPPSLQLPIPYSPFVVPERKGLFPEGYKFSITLSNHACIIFETKQALFNFLLSHEKSKLTFISLESLCGI